MFSKRRSLFIFFFMNRGPLKALNDSIWILVEFEWSYWWFKIYLESFRTFKSPRARSLFLNKTSGRELHFENTFHSVFPLNVKKILVIGFEFGYAVTALYFKYKHYWQMNQSSYICTSSKNVKNVEKCSKKSARFWAYLSMRWQEPRS